MLQQNVAELRKKIEEEQRMLMQFAEERLALAQSLLGLLELHVTQANKDISAFEIELQVQSASARTRLHLHDSLHIAYMSCWVAGCTCAASSACSHVCLLRCFILLHGVELHVCYSACSSAYATLKSQDVSMLSTAGTECFHGGHIGSVPQPS